MKLCDKAEKLIARYSDLMVDANGEPTYLYYHIKYCDKCYLHRIAREEEKVATKS